MKNYREYLWEKTNASRKAKLSFLILLLMLSFSVAAKPLYQYRDSNGNLVFSDKLPSTSSFKEVKLQDINLTRWEVVKPKTLKGSKKITRGKSKNSKKNSSSESTLSNCKKLSRSIEQLDAMLKHRLNASEFDQTKKELSNLRWKHRKSC